jgi:hypothetical protein
MTYLHSESETTWGIESPPWWNTADLVHSDFVSEDSDKIVSMTAGSTWRDLDMAWTNNIDTVVATGNVVFADFKSDHETK